MNHKPRRLLENCLCAGKKAGSFLLLLLFFFPPRLVVYTPMVCQLQKKKKNGVNKQARTCASASCVCVCVCGTSIKRTLQRRHKARKKRKKKKRWHARFRWHAAFLITPLRLGPGAAWFPAEVKSVGAAIIMALIGIKREWSESEEDVAPSDRLVRITRTAGEFAEKKAEVEKEKKNKKKHKDEISEMLPGLIFHSINSRLQSCN